jgi:hypothetical protein
MRVDISIPGSWGTSLKGIVVVVVVVVLAVLDVNIVT